MTWKLELYIYIYIYIYIYMYIYICIYIRKYCRHINISSQWVMRLIAFVVWIISINVVFSQAPISNRVEIWWQKQYDVARPTHTGPQNMSEGWRPSSGPCRRPWWYESDKMFAFRNPAEFLLLRKPAGNFYDPFKTNMKEALSIPQLH